MPSSRLSPPEGKGSHGDESLSSDEREDGRSGFREPSSGTQPCRFFLRGRCTKGKACPFPHVARESGFSGFGQSIPGQHRTAPEPGPPNGHGDVDGRRDHNAPRGGVGEHHGHGHGRADGGPRPVAGPTAASGTAPPCKNWAAEGACRFGSSCHFRHDPDRGAHAHGPPHPAPNAVRQAHPFAAGVSPCWSGEDCTNKRCWFSHPAGRRCENPRSVSMLFGPAAEEHDRMEHRLKELHATMKPPDGVDEEAIKALLCLERRGRRGVAAAAYDAPGTRLRDDAFTILTDASGHCTELELHVCDVAAVVLSQPAELARSILHAAARLQEPSYPPDGRPVKVLPAGVLQHGSLCSEEYRPSLTLRQALQDDGRTVRLVGEPTLERTMVILETAAFFDDFDAIAADDDGGGGGGGDDGEKVRRACRVAAAVAGVGVPTPGDALFETQLAVFRTPDQPCPPLERRTKYVDAVPRNITSAGQFCVSAFNRLFASAAVRVMAAADPEFQLLGFVRRLPQELAGVTKAEVAALARGAYSLSDVCDSMSEFGWAAEIALVTPALLEDPLVLCDCRVTAPLREYVSLYNAARLGAFIDLAAVDDSRCGEYAAAVAAVLPFPEPRQLAGLTKGMQRCRLRDKFIARAVTLPGPPSLVSVEAKGGALDASGLPQSATRIAAIVVRYPGQSEEEVLCVRPPIGRRRLCSTFESTASEKEEWRPLQGYLCTKTGRVMASAAGSLPTDLLVNPITQS